jgi:hypothetical protein
MRKTSNSPRGNRYRTAVIGLGVFGLALFGGSNLGRLWPGSPRLVSIEEMPDTGDACARPTGTDSGPGLSGTSSLFAAFEQPSVYAQDSGGTIDMNLPPVRDLTGYVASGIALDPAHNEIILSAAGQRVRPPRGIMNTVITFSWPEIFN